ncbi:hypothetical protein DAEQUDRAFT_55729 [Daedalea quercina L-15889]|uniref:Uncharacterized protein n=1 Tax=Daedalea quercina L-15889 TaxID=1314783 RepID=A0A165SJD0_9APHY|nr:hypothetical protein DAEQUDRAFT_55729 [Daedalea quercina L-15889]
MKSNCDTIMTSKVHSSRHTRLYMSYADGTRLRNGWDENDAYSFPTASHRVGSTEGAGSNVSHSRHEVGVTFNSDEQQTAVVMMSIQWPAWISPRLMNKTVKYTPVSQVFVIRSLANANRYTLLRHARPLSGRGVICNVNRSVQSMGICRLVFNMNVPDPDLEPTATAYPEISTRTARTPLSIITEIV